ncbi:small ribosomal subunit protein mS23 isoform X1 [Lethenteron reissneri]|uniref:small ribosomal subunit protein mS23 isoform X1 n=2 Tax=Lethenteron reissneri TaxID=7753 RepID=UPI002AB7130C|nr:small ribosomal subunit protein mS23 isoform X1 [Lethenteron reissneri]
MAGLTRIERHGTIFSRVRDLMRAQVIKEADRPLWYDIYAAFPPKREPKYQGTWTPLLPTRSQRKVAHREQLRPEPDPVRAIVYAEDTVRARFFQTYTAGRYDLTRPNFVSLSQRFVQRYEELQASGDHPEENLFEETGKALLADGIVLRRKGSKLETEAEAATPVGASDQPSEPAAS